RRSPRPVLEKQIAENEPPGATSPQPPLRDRTSIQVEARPRVLHVHLRGEGPQLGRHVPRGQSREQQRRRGRDRAVSTSPREARGPNGACPPPGASRASTSAAEDVIAMRATAKRTRRAR